MNALETKLAELKAEDDSYWAAMSAVENSPAYQAQKQRLKEVTDKWFAAHSAHGALSAAIPILNAQLEKTNENKN